MPREEDPSFKISGFSISAILPGADPKDLERLVASRSRIGSPSSTTCTGDRETIVDGVSFTVIEFEA
jgi:multidrug efflux pump subunit AcrB